LAAVFRRATTIALGRPTWTHEDLAGSLHAAAMEFGLDSREVALAAGVPIVLGAKEMVPPFTRETAATTFERVAAWFDGGQTSPG
jgi:hypothetical protein